MVVESSYRYALLGVVGLVTLVAIFAIVGPYLKSPQTAQDNAVGQLSYYFPPPSEEFTVDLADSITYNYVGVDYEIKLIGVFQPDDTKKESAIITVNGIWTGRMRPGNVKALEKNNMPMRLGIELVSLDGDSARVKLLFTDVPYVEKEYMAGVPDALFTGETKTYTVNGYDQEITLLFVGPEGVKFSANGIVVGVLRKGESAIVENGATITLLDYALGTKGVAEFVIAQPEPECTRDGQTATCRGNAACCSGQCVQLPSCADRKDGPIPGSGIVGGGGGVATGSFMCGQRQLYCCGGQLSLEACKQEIECKWDSDCPVINCFKAPCPQNRCVNGACVSSQNCINDADCATGEICDAGVCVGLPTPVGGNAAVNLYLKEGMPPPVVYDRGSFPFSINLVAENVGEADIGPGTENPYARARVEGILPESFGVTPDDLLLSLQTRLDGVGSDGTIAGGQATYFVFEGLAYQPALQGNEIVTLRNTLCYDYTNLAHSAICLGSSCDAGESAVANSAGPIHITSVVQNPISAGRSQLNFVVEHVGTGEFYGRNNGENCNPSIKNANKYAVDLEITTDRADMTVSCYRLDDTNHGRITLYNGAPQTITCILTQQPVPTPVEPAYESSEPTIAVPPGPIDEKPVTQKTFVTIKSSYRYSQFLEQPILIKPAPQLADDSGFGPLPPEVSG